MFRPWLPAQGVLTRRTELLGALAREAEFTPPGERVHSFRSAAGATFDIYQVRGQRGRLGRRPGGPPSHAVTVP